MRQRQPAKGGRCPTLRLCYDTSSVVVMAQIRPKRGWVPVAAIALAAVVLTVLFLAPPAGSQSGIRLGVDVASFSQRAAAWSSANVVHRSAAVERAAALGKQAAEAEAEAERQAALAAARTTTTSSPPSTTTSPPPTTTISSPTTTVTPVPTGGPTADQWAALRNCESSGRYDAISPSGRYRGAYQFSQATWDWVASFSNPALVGVDPAAASIADQDAQAFALYDRNGAGPWPHCGAYLS